MTDDQHLTVKLDAHADWLEHAKDMPKNAELIRSAAARIREHAFRSGCEAYREAVAEAQAAAES